LSIAVNGVEGAPRVGSIFSKPFKHRATMDAAPQPVDASAHGMSLSSTEACELSHPSVGLPYCSVAKFYAPVQILANACITLSQSNNIPKQAANSNGQPFIALCRTWCFRSSAVIEPSLCCAGDSLGHSPRPAFSLHKAFDKVLRKVGARDKGHSMLHPPDTSVGTGATVSAATSRRSSLGSLGMVEGCPLPEAVSSGEAPTSRHAIMPDWQVSRMRPVGDEQSLRGCVRSPGQVREVTRPM
jgi:hypothetical protein